MACRGDAGLQYSPGFSLTPLSSDLNGTLAHRSARRKQVTDVETSGAQGSDIWPGIQEFRDRGSQTTRVVQVDPVGR
jgi:hypothetical protein